MDTKILEKYVDKVYAYSIRRTFSDDEAADLSQEIVLCALKNLSKLRDDDKFEPWLWGLAENVTKSFSRRRGRERATFFYDMPDIPTDDAPDDDIMAEYGVLREKVAYLSKIYREVTVLYYFDGLSTKQIAARLNVPEGTITWRLSEARRKIKKEFDDMEQSALKPKKLGLDIYGNGNFDGRSRPFPTAFINDALSQNILLYCYDEPHSIEEIAKYSGVPAYYVEDRVNNLVRRNAMVEESKGKYLTDFLIFDDSYGVFCAENAEKTMRPISDELGEVLKSIAKEAFELDHYKGTKSESDLFYLYAVLALNHVKKNNANYPQISEKYDGFRWNYLGSIESRAHERIGICTNLSAHNGEHGTYSHAVYSRFAGIKWHRMMYDYYIDACADILKTGAPRHKPSAADAIEEGYIIRSCDGSLKVTSPAFTSAQKAEFDAIVDKNFEPILDKYNSLTQKFVDGYKKVFPKRFADEAERFTSDVSLGITAVERMAQTGAVPPPSKDYVCDVLLEQ